MGGADDADLHGKQVPTCVVGSDDHEVRLVVGDSVSSGFRGTQFPISVVRVVMVLSRGPVYHRITD